MDNRHQRLKDIRLTDISPKRPKDIMDNKPKRPKNIIELRPKRHNGQKT